ncbi:MAG: S-layer homology domain-containing protein [Clostridia bacterium]|nr:S-layer homology domain-containing protein [Clostridia bacterium]
MKKIIAIFLLFATITGSVTAMANATSQLPLLSELNIMVGDESGNLHLDRLVTRAEFTKMIVASSAYRNTVAKGLKTSSYKDVSATHWAASYIKVGVDNGLCKGYTDATFRPENNVKFEEAVTMLLRILGYNDEDFGNSWPYGQLGLAENLGLTDGVQCTVGEELTRKKVAILVYNTLNTKMKNSTQKLISDFDIQKIEDVILISVNNTRKNEVYTSKGVFEFDSGIGSDDIGKYGDLYIESGKDVVAFIPDTDEISTQKHIVYSTLEDNVITYSGNKINSIEIPLNTTVYEKDAKITYGTVKVEMGDVLYICRKPNNDIDYIIYEKGVVEGPFTATSAYDMQKYSDSRILRDGESITFNGIQQNDIIYYVPDLNAVFCYSNKVTGVYEKAEPNKDTPAYITVSGKSYKIESAAAFEKLSSAGDFKYGDTVTLLLGKNNDVCDVMGTGSEQTDVCGYMFETGTKEYTKSDLNKITSMYIKIVTPDGRVNEYQTDKNYEKYKNSVRRIVFADGKAIAENVSSAKIQGIFDWNKKTLGDMILANNIKILDVSTTDSNEYGNYITVFPARLDGVKLLKEDVLYFEKNEKNQIESMILNNVTGDMYSYGIVKKAENTNNSFMLAGNYESYINGNLVNYTVSGVVFNVRSGQVAQFTFGKSGELANIKPLILINGNITEVNKTSLKSGNTKYPLSDNVQVYLKDNNNNYTIIPIGDITDGKDYDLTAYYDKAVSSGGRVRVIVAKP